MHDSDILRAAASVIHDHDLSDKGIRDELGGLADDLEQQAAKAQEPIPWTAGLFTRQEAETARDHAIAILTDELHLGERDVDLLGLASAMAAELIDNPGITFDEMIRERYDESPAKVRAWWTAWS